MLVVDCRDKEGWGEGREGEKEGLNSETVTMTMWLHVHVYGRARRPCIGHYFVALIEHAMEQQFSFPLHFLSPSPSLTLGSSSLFFKTVLSLATMLWQSLWMPLNDGMCWYCSSTRLAFTYVLCGVSGSDEAKEQLTDCSEGCGLGVWLT